LALSGPIQKVLSPSFPYLDDSAHNGRNIDILWITGSVKTTMTSVFPPTGTLAGSSTPRADIDIEAALIFGNVYGEMGS
jgi:hypothetical protein